MILSKPFQSFQIDSLSKRWAAVLLLLFAWGVSFWFLKYPPGDPDFSQFMYWYEDMMEAEDYISFVEANPFEKAFTIDNMVYMLSVGVYISVMYLIGLFYFTMYGCDLRNVSISKAPGIFFTRIWWLVLYSSSICIPALLLIGFLPFAFLFFIPSFYLRPGLVFFEKKDAYTSTLLSSLRTRGHRLSIFVELSGILLIYVLLHLLVMFVLSEGSVGLYLVEGFLRAYFVLVAFRNMGARYHMVTVLENE